MNNPSLQNNIKMWDVSALVYLSIPLMLFIWGWLEPWIAIPLILFIVFSIWKLTFVTIKNTNKIRFVISPREYIPSLLIFVLYIFMTGMTGNWAQHTDYYVRNDIFWELTTKSWPPNLPDERYFIYYFQSWLPAALFGSFLGWKIAQWAYFLWTVLGMIISLHYIFKSVGKISFWVACIFFAWNGLELIPCSLLAPLLQDISISEAFMQNDHVAGHFLTEAPCFSMKNIVHCFVPISIIGGMLLQSGNVRSIGFSLGILAVMYSPMSSIFLLPILLYLFIREYVHKNTEGKYALDWRCMIKEGLSVYNISYMAPFFLLIIPFYAGAESFHEAKPQLLFDVKNFTLFCVYLFFNSVISVMLIRRNVKSYFVWLVFVVHSLCMLSGLIFHDDIAMKGSVATTYFLIILYCQAFCRENTRFKIVYVIYSMLGALFFVHMTGALLCVVVAIGCRYLLRLKIWQGVSALAALVLTLVATEIFMPQMLTSYKDKLAGKQVRYHRNMGVYQQDGGSGLWWWYRTFPHRKDMPIWFK